jgi:hypothetical protein
MAGLSILCIRMSFISVVILVQVESGESCIPFMLLRHFVKLLLWHISPLQDGACGDTKSTDIQNLSRI